MKKTITVNVNEKAVALYEIFGVPLEVANVIVRDVREIMGNKETTCAQDLVNLVSKYSDGELIFALLTHAGIAGMKMCAAALNDRLLGIFSGGSVCDCDSCADKTCSANKNSGGNIQ